MATAPNVNPSYHNTLAQNGGGATGFAPSYSSGHGGAYSMSKLTLSNPMDAMVAQLTNRPTMIVGWSNDDVETRFFGTDDLGNNIDATFAPEFDITASEHVKITQLMFLITTAAMTSSTGVLRQINSIAYIKKHNLERHFKMAAGKP